jgi:osmoprotectant transport system permease protein
MHVFGQVLHWFTSPNHLTGPNGVPARTVEHVEMSLLATGIAVALAVPVGLLIGHTKRAEFLAVSIANIGRALPSFGILGIVFPFTINLPGLGFYPTLIALFLLAIPPILTNTYVGIKNVDPDTVEAARGMGMSEADVLLRIELPLAAPVLVAGIRTAAVAVVATATLAAVFGWGGYGRYIFDGFAQDNMVMVLAGAILVALLAIVTEIVLGGFERLVRPRSSSRPSPNGLRSRLGGVIRGDDPPPLESP